MHIPEHQQLVERAEEVSSELVHVGDYVYSSTTARSEPLSLSTCVLVKVPIRSQTQNRVVGWQIGLANGTSMWLLRGALVKRRRFAKPAALPRAA